MKWRFINAALLAALSGGMCAVVQAQPVGNIDRVKLTDGEASCLQLHTEIGDMDKIAAAAKAEQEKSSTTATAAGAANVAAEVVGRTGGFFGAFGSVVGGIVGQTATQAAAGAAKQSAEQSAQQSGERIRQAQARKEHLTTLFLAKACKVSDLSAQGKTLSPEELNKAINPAPAATASTPLAVDIPDLTPKEYMKPWDSHLTEELKKNRGVAIGGFRVAFVTKAVAADSIRASYQGGGVHNSGVNTRVEMTLRNVDLARMQALTEQAYKEFLATLAQSGIEVAGYDKFSAHKAFAEISFAGKGDGQPYTTETGGRTYTVLSPAGMKLWFGQAEVLGDQGAFGWGNGRKAGEFAFDNKLVVLNPLLVVDFAETSAGRNKGIFGFRNRTDVAVKSAISLRPGAGMTQMLLVARSAPIESAIAYGMAPLAEPVMFNAEFGKLETREQNSNRSLVVGLGALGLSGGPVRETQKDDLMADPARYEALAGGALLAGSRLMARSVVEVLKQ
jgi:hypothetical protein